MNFTLEQVTASVQQREYGEVGMWLRSAQVYREQVGHLLRHGRYLDFRATVLKRRIW